MFVDLAPKYCMTTTGPRPSQPDCSKIEQQRPVLESEVLLFSNMDFSAASDPIRLPRLHRWIERQYRRLSSRCNLFAVVLCSSLLFHEILSYIRWMKSPFDDDLSLADVFIFGLCRLLVVVATAFTTPILFVGAGCFCGCVESLSRLTYRQITTIQLAQLAWCILLLGDDVYHVTKLQNIQKAAERATEAAPLVFSAPAVVSGLLATVLGYRSPRLPLANDQNLEENFEQYSDEASQPTLDDEDGPLSEALALQEALRRQENVCFKNSEIRRLH